MEWVASTLHTTSEHVVARKTKSGFCACAITFQSQSTNSIIRAKNKTVNEVIFDMCLL